MLVLSFYRDAKVLQGLGKELWEQWKLGLRVGAEGVPRTGAKLRRRMLGVAAVVAAEPPGPGFPFEIEFFEQNPDESFQKGRGLVWAE